MYSLNYFAENAPVYLIFNGSSHSAARVGTKWNKRIKGLLAWPKTNSEFE
jgi:hypothetical protein